MRKSMKEFKIQSFETVSEVSQKSNVKIVIYVKRKRDQKVKRIKKHSRTSPDEQFKKFIFNDLKITRPRTDYE